MLVRVGTGLSTEKVKLVEVPPPGVGLLTVTSKSPGAVSLLAGMIAVSIVDERYVVVSAPPLNSAFDLAINPLPVSVIWVSPLPASACVGLTAVRIGVGLATVKVSELLLPPYGFGLLTWTPNRPPVANWVAESVMVSSVEEMNVVVWLLPPK